MSVNDLISLARDLAELGYCPGGAGNVSWRDGDDIFITRSGVDLQHLEPADLVRVQVDWQQRITVGETHRASKELPLHLAMHARSPIRDGFVGHVHSSQGVGVSCLPPYSRASAIPPLTPYFVMKVGEVPLIEYAKPGSQAQADAMFAFDSDAHTMLLQNHGLVAWATHTDSLLDRIRESEITCGTWLQLRGTEGIHLLSDADQAELQRSFPQSR